MTTQAELETIIGNEIAKGDAGDVLGALARHRTHDWVRHFDGKYTFEWGGAIGSFNNVIEYNVFEGDATKDKGLSHFRLAALMECDHNAIIKLNELFHAHDPAAYKALRFVHEAMHDGDAILGYDFQRNEPRVLLYLGQGQVGIR